MKKNNNQLFSALIIAGAMILSTYLVVTQWNKNAKSNQTIEVTGSAKKDIVSDLGVVRGTLVVEAKSAKEAYNTLKIQQKTLFNYLKEKGIPEENINTLTIGSSPTFETNAQGYQTTNILSYVYTQRFEIQSTDVKKIKELSTDIASLIELGVTFLVEQPEYYFTKLADLKIEIQAAAAKDAMERAKKIALATGKDIGSIKNADMGVLQITPKNSNMVSDYGMNDVSSIEKEISAVVHAHFFME